VYQALLQEGHEVFFDESELRAAGGYHAKIRKEVKQSDGFVFLISPASLAQGCYTLTELGYAKKKWKDPTGHVLPVMIEPMPMQSVDGYLRAVSVMTPQGNAAAEIADAVSELTPSEDSVDKAAVRAAADLPFYIKCTNKQLAGAAHELRVRYGLTTGAVVVGVGVFALAWLFPPLAQLKEIISAGGTAISGLAALPAKGIMPARAKLGALELLCTGFESIPPSAASSGNERMTRLVDTFYKLLDAELGTTE
jgi:hypothetical protein